MVKTVKVVWAGVGCHVLWVVGCRSVGGHALESSIKVSKLKICTDTQIFERYGYIFHPLNTYLCTYHTYPYLPTYLPAILGLGARLLGRPAGTLHDDKGQACSLGFSNVPVENRPVPKTCLSLPSGQIDRSKLVKQGER
jgi:hypothetical protein